MWTVMVVAMLALALVTWVWARQARHSEVGGGKNTAPEVRLQQQGKYWGYFGAGGG